MLVVVLTSGMLGACNAGSGQDSLDSFDWRNDWAVREGFTLSIDASGFELPTAIAFVEEPGTEPDDPLYFITELRGAIKVVTNDRSVALFADVPNIRPEVELPVDPAAEIGMAGLCLDGVNGYVFVTYSGPDSSGTLRNRILRFDTAPTTFATSPRAVTELAVEISEVLSSPSHQIGGCTVIDASLYVGIGDGHEPHKSQLITDPRGKVLRLTLDGDGHPENPFVNEPGNVTSMVWAYGLRNPFSITHVNGQIYVADNGPSVDRFMSLQRGRNYQWDGTDQSMSLGVDVVFPVAIGPGQLSFVPHGSSLVPGTDAEVFYVGMNASSRDHVGLMAIPYSIVDQQAQDPPFVFVEYTGPAINTAGAGVAAVAIGPDALYFVRLIPDRKGETHILKLEYDPANEHPVIIGRTGNGVNVSRCQACHFFRGEGGLVGPSLHLTGPDSFYRKSQLQAKLDSDEFQATLRSMNEQDLDSLNALRQQVLDSTGDERMFNYVRNKIINPKFADALAQMPNLRIEPMEADRVASFLLGSQTDVERSLKEKLIARRIPRAVRELIPTPETRTGDFLAGGILGLAAAVALSSLVWFALRQRKAKTPREG